MYQTPIHFTVEADHFKLLGYKEEMHVKSWDGKTAMLVLKPSSFTITLNVDVMVQFFLENMAGFFYLLPGGQDVTELHRMNPLQDLPSLPSSPFPLTPVFLPSLSHRDTRQLAGKSGVPSTANTTLVFLLSDPFVQACLIPLPMLP